MLSGDDLLAGVVGEANPNVAQATAQSNEVVEQYSATVQQEVIDPAQQQLLAAMQQFVNETAISGSSFGELGNLDGTPIEELASEFAADETTETVTENGTAVVDSELNMALDEVDSGTASTDSVFEQGADLAEISQQLVTDALSGSGSGSESASSGDAASSGDSASTGGTTTGGTAAGGTTAGGTATTTTAAGGSGWGSGRPDGVQFDSVSLPLQSFVGDLLQFRPTELTSFTHTTVIVLNSEESATAESVDDGAAVEEGDAPSVTTTVNTRSVLTTLTITISQTYIDADHWSVSQSWTKEYIVTGGSSQKTPAAEPEPEPGADPTGSTGVSGAAAEAGESGVVPKPAHTTPTVPPEKHTSSSTSVETGVESFSITVTSAGTSSVSYSKSDTITNSVGETWNNGSDTTGGFDQSGFSGSSSQSQTLNFSLSESLVTMADGTPGRKTVLGFGGSKTASMSMSGHYGNFEADGTVMDKDGNPTTGAGKPMNSPNNSPWMLPPLVPADPTDPTITPSPDPDLGGNGSRFEAGGGFSISGSFATGFYLNGEVTMPDGGEIAESAISGATGFYTTMDSGASVSDMLSFDSQESSGSVANGDDQFDYLSLGWTNSAGGSMNFAFSMDMDLTDADLPDEPPADEGTGGSDDGSGSSEGGSSSGGSSDGGSSDAGGSEAGSSSGVGSGSEGGSGASGGTTGSGGSGGTPSGDPDAEPEPGKPVVKFEFGKNSNSGNGVWLRYQSKTIEFSNGPVGENPLASPMKTTTESGISIGLNGSVSFTTTTDIFSLNPSVTVQAGGHASVSFVISTGKVMEMHNAEWPPEGWQTLISDSERFYNYSDETISTVGFKLTLVAAVSGLTLSGDATIGFERHITDKSGCKSHLKYEKISDPSVTYETWSMAFTLYDGSVTTTGGLGAAGNALTTEVSETWGGGSESSSEGTPPEPPIVTPPPDVFTTALDYVQTGLDVAGMVPVLGEGCDLLNAGISLGRGNFGDAAFSIGAMIPFAGAGVTAAKFGNKAVKTIAKNADKLDETADSFKAIKQACENGPNCFVAGTQVVVAMIGRGKQAVEAEPLPVLIDEAEFDPSAAVAEASPVPLDVPADSHGASALVAAFGLTLGVLRQMWPSLSQPRRPRKRRRGAEPQVVE